MTRKLMLFMAGAAMAIGIASTAQAQNVRAFVRIYNNSNNWLVFQMKSANSRWGSYRIAPRATKKLTCNCTYTPHFRIRVGTQGRAPVYYNLRPSRTYQIKYDQNLRKWNVFTMNRAGTARPFVRIYNSSNRRLVFFLKSQNSRWGRYYINARTTRRYTCRCEFTNYFTVRIVTNLAGGGQRAKVYTLVQGLRYRFYFNNGTGLWDVARM